MEFRLRVPLQVRFRDLDALGHVNNAVFVTYLEVARVEYWRRVVRPAGGSAFDFVVARVECDFRAPAFLDTPLEVAIRATGFGRTSFKFEYEVVRTDTGESVARARTVQVFVDPSGVPKPLPEDLRARVEAFEGS